MSHSAVAAEVDYPEKMFYRINEVSRITGVKPYVLRYWETEFPQLKPAKDGSDQRRYRRKDIDLLLQIKSLLYEEKYTIAGARRWFQKKTKAQEAQVVQVQPLAPSVDSQQVKRVRRKLQQIRRDINDLCKFI